MVALAIYNFEMLCAEGFLLQGGTVESESVLQGGKAKADKEPPCAGACRERRMEVLAEADGCDGRTGLCVALTGCRLGPQP